MDRLGHFIFRFVLLVLVFARLPAWTEARAETANPADSGSTKRVALVIGIGDYLYAPKLTNPPNDARLIAAQLQASGFKLVGDGALVNLDRNTFANALNDFSAMAAGADVALFYYAGHGMQLLDTNWLMPVSANPEKPTDLAYQAIDIGDVLTRLDRSAAKFKLVLLDACRNNPFLGVGSRAATGSGLMRVDAPDGTLISYATKPGHVAQDGAGANSPYTEALATIMAQPGIPVLSLFNQLGVAVKRATQGAQEPWFSTSPIEKEFVFASLPRQTAVGQASGPVAPPPAAPVPTEGAGPAQPHSPGPSGGPDQPADAQTDVRVFEWIDQKRNLPRDADLLAQPVSSAARVASLQAGKEVFVAGLIVGGEWLQIRLLDNVTIGYALAERVPELADPDQLPDPQPARPAYLVSTQPPPQPIAGRPVVHDTATLLIDDRVVPLSEIEGFGGPLTSGLQQYLSAKGDHVSCQAADPGRYACTTPDGADLAAAALVNGAAKAAPGAPASYLAQQAEAQRNGRGIWTQSAALPVKPAPLPRNAVYAAAAPPPAYIEPSAAPQIPDQPESEYGVAEIDGEAMTVVDGHRVVVDHTDARGWSYRDGAGVVHGLPLAVTHDLDHFYRARPIPAVTAGLVPRGGAEQHAGAPSIGHGASPGIVSAPGVGHGVSSGMAAAPGAGIVHGTSQEGRETVPRPGGAPHPGAPGAASPATRAAQQYAEAHAHAAPAFSAPAPVSGAHGFAQTMTQRSAPEVGGGAFHPMGTGGGHGTIMAQHVGAGRAAPPPAMHSCSKKC